MLTSFWTKYENLQTVAKLFQQNYFFGTFHLKDGYQHVPIVKSHKKYSRFAWKLATEARSISNLQFYLLVWPQLVMTYKIQKNQR